MTAAAAVAVAINRTWLAVTLVVGAVYFAAILASVGGYTGLIRGQVVPSAVGTVHEASVVDFRSYSPRTELVLNESVALHASIMGHLSAARACTLRV